MHDGWSKRTAASILKNKKLSVEKVSLAVLLILLPTYALLPAVHLLQFTKVTYLLNLVEVRETSGRSSMLRKRCSIGVHGQQGYLLRKCCQTTDSNFVWCYSSMRSLSHFLYDMDRCSRLLMMGRQMRSQCHIKKMQHPTLTIKSSWPKRLVLRYSTCRYFVVRWKFFKSTWKIQITAQINLEANSVHIQIHLVLFVDATFDLSGYSCIRRAPLFIFSMLDDKKQGFNESTWATAAALLFQNGISSELSERFSLVRFFSISWCIYT